jgi:hypothetical protein
MGKGKCFKCQEPWIPGHNKIANSGIKCISYQYKMVTLVMKIILRGPVMKKQLQLLKILNYRYLCKISTKNLELQISMHGISG